MDINNKIESPFTIKLSFNKLLNEYERLAKGSDESITTKAQRVIKTVEDIPLLRNGFSDLKYLSVYEKEIKSILQDTFSPLLTNNEIKTATVPFQDIFFNFSNRFKSILKNAGEDYHLEVRNISENEKYIHACTFILNFYYGYKLNLKRPFLYQIPDKKGVMRYYKILYNADFIEISPKKDTKKITKEDYEKLLDNFENINLWKEKFPPNSYEFKGFAISNIFDVTDDQSISNIKSSLIKNGNHGNGVFMGNFQEIFRSLFGFQNLEVGFSTYNKKKNTFERVYGIGMNSFLLNKKDDLPCIDALCEWSYNKLIRDNAYFSVSDVEKSQKLPKGKLPHIKTLYDQGFKSAIFAPIVNQSGLLGVLEIASKEPKSLNSINANKLVDVMPFIISAVERSIEEEANQIEAVIQKECTSIHPSVHWKFEKEARNFIKEQVNGKGSNFNKIAFENVYPLYGQIDIKGSSEVRNRSTQQDLTMQLVAIRFILKNANNKKYLDNYEDYIFKINEFLKKLESNFQVDSEKQVSNFIKNEIEPILKTLYKIETLRVEIDQYYASVDENVDAVYHHRKFFDETITSINREMASFLDNKQTEAQTVYPHYFERFKTDGVEHNMYIGDAISSEIAFNLSHLHNLRLWQLQVMIGMENAYYQMQSEFPIAMDVASMILVFNQPLSISFRMDEKQFDVDGTYNARYEIIKKRVDKAYIKGTNERVTQKGKISIIYSQKEDEREYLKYIVFLQSKNQLDDDVEIVEIQDLQAVTGLKAIRVSILYSESKVSKDYFSYEDLTKS